MILFTPASLRLRSRGKIPSEERKGGTGIEPHTGTLLSGLGGQSFATHACCSSPVTINRSCDPPRLLPVGLPRPRAGAEPEGLVQPRELQSKAECRGSDGTKRVLKRVGRDAGCERLMWVTLNAICVCVCPRAIRARLDVKVGHESVDEVVAGRLGRVGWVGTTGRGGTCLVSGV